MPNTSIRFRLSAALGALAITALAGMALAAAPASPEKTPDSTLSLLVMLVGAIVALLAVLTAMAAAFGSLKLTDKGQAMGLPEGSIRALIALMLLVTFAVLAVFLYDHASRGGAGDVEALTQAQSSAFVAAHADYPNLKSAPMNDKDGKPVQTTGATPEPLYSVSWTGATAADDFAKQLMNVLETLLTSVVSFYFGAKTATSAAAAAAAAKTP